jgi:hypothetical protein
MKYRSKKRKKIFYTKAYPLRIGFFYWFDKLIDMSFFLNNSFQHFTDYLFNIIFYWIISLFVYVVFFLIYILT